MSEFAAGNTFLSGATVSIIGEGYTIDVAETAEPFALPSL